MLFIVDGVNENTKSSCHSQYLVIGKNNMHWCNKVAYYKARFTLPEMTGDQFPLPVNTGRVDGRSFPLAVLTGHQHG